MIKKQKYEIRDLPEIPNDAEFMLGNVFAKIVDNTLYLWCYENSDKGVVKSWASTGRTLDECNNYIESEDSDLSLPEILYKEFRFGNNIYKSHSSSKKERFYVFKNWDGVFYVSYYYPKLKGFKGEEKRNKYGAGECIKIRSTAYPQLEDLVGNNIVEVDTSVVRFFKNNGKNITLPRSSNEGLNTFGCIGKFY